jgi:hypothetical protein
MQVTFYLTQASANTAAGPFNISGTTSGGAANTVEIQAGVSKAILLTGYTEEIANNITGGTVTSTGATCNTTDTWSIDELFVTPTPTPTPLPDGVCWTLVYDNLLPGDLYVRYRDNLSDTTITELINGIQALDNGNSTYTAGICVKSTGAYATPVFVQGGSEQSGGSYTWNSGGACTTAPVCLIN